MRRILLPLLVILTIAMMACTVAFAGNGDIGQDKAEEARKKHTERLMRIEGVVGVGLGKGTVVVLTRNGDVKGIPAKVDNVPIDVFVSGDITITCHRDRPHGSQDSLCPPPGPEETPTPQPTSVPGSLCADTTAKHRPACTGISTGHFNITACTIAARVTNGTDYFALSNNHCYAVGNTASIGDAILQPGTFDGGVTPADDIGTLSDFGVINCTSSSNKIDAAIAKVDPANLLKTTPSNGYGEPRSRTKRAFVGQEVMKYGRSSELTVGTVYAVNTIVYVGGYPCGPVYFNSQMLIIPGDFGIPGDSGSLVVDTDRYPVGLYFAGNSTIGVANPIKEVLREFKVTIDGE